MCFTILDIGPLPNLCTSDGHGLCYNYNDVIMMSHLIVAHLSHTNNLWCLQELQRDICLDFFQRT